ncbi:nickel-dependent lactate racemase [Methanohalophilus sp. RSK]|uniref:nickel-dependent lactate racemase n=1 Tax=Methanohalophilus sp. RSK TaxID=2485783 RepID=UPI000F43B852|nr:nickel-dependent lactate racemase [Methanohalophilus sp. RSK]RNI14912.1 nickel-dependent lactate racemase [Methanohalophilus sp. RSK]
MTVITVPYGNESIDVKIPDSNMGNILMPCEMEVESTPEKLVKNALANPVNSKRLSEIVTPKSSVAIIVSDITRPSPSSTMLPLLIEELKSGGCTEENVTVVCALGLHRQQTEDEIKKILGPLYGKVRFVEHDKENCVRAGTTSGGTPVEIFKDVYESDIVVCTGNIEFHYYAGYSGGAKAILPGVSSNNSVITNHKMMTLEEATTGNIDSPVRQDMEEAAQIFGPDFLLNVILNSKKEIVQAVAGDIIDAHRKGVECVDNMYKVEVKPADVVITATDVSKGMNLYQAYKPLDNAKMAVIEGGTILLVAPCGEGFGHEIFERWSRQCSCPAETIEKFDSDFEFGAHKAAFIAQLAMKHDLLMYSEMPEKDVQDVFFKPVADIQQTIDSIIAENPAVRIHFMPHGQSTLPITKEKN